MRLAERCRGCRPGGLPSVRHRHDARPERESLPLPHGGQRLQRPAAPAPPHGAAPPPTLVSDEEERTLEAEARRLGTLLDRLPAEQAEVIRLHTFASMRFTEIAETLELPASTVKSRFHYGIERLKALI